MANAEAGLDGSGPQTIYIDVYRTGQDWGANRTDFRILVVYRAKGFGSWINQTQSWSANAGGHAWSGNFVIGSPGTSDITLLDTGFSHYHDGEGWLGGFNSSAYISTNHTRIGSGGVSVYEEAAPRIPKTPTAPQNLSAVNITPVSAGVTYGGPADWRGSSGQGYTADWHEIFPAGGSQLIWQDLNSNGYTSPANGVGPTLKPGTTYHVYVYARSNVGNGPASGIALKTLSGAYVWDGSKWDADEVYVWNGGGWGIGEVHYWNGSGWVLAS